MALMGRQVVTCFLESDNEILILRRSKKVGSFPGRWAAVSGYLETVDPGEQALTEIVEETSLSGEDLRLVKRGEPFHVVDEITGVPWIVHPFLFHIADRGKVRIDWEHEETRWIPPQELGEYETVPALKEILARVCDF